MENKNYRTSLILGAIFLFLAVGIGAFGAHGLKNIVTGKYIETYKTGVTYHFYHGFALMILGLIGRNFSKLNITVPLWSFVGGILIFSFNCYIYAITTTKTFAMIVPIGGFLFLIGWAALAFQLVKNGK
jgi:uncharacterized membrane protein YgdD (TMEM256/DUF423 family)